MLPDIQPHSRVAFIINNDTSDKPGTHWNAVYIDARNGPESSNSVEWFDSFGRPIPSDILQDLKLILKCLKPETILKVKKIWIVLLIVFIIFLKKLLYKKIIKYEIIY